MPTPEDPSPRPGPRRTVQTLVTGPILLAVGIRGLLTGPHSWPRTALWIGCIAVGSATLLVGVALLYARRGKSGGVDAP